MTSPLPNQQPPTSAWSMYRAIVGIGALCALLIVTVYAATATRIQENQERFLALAVSEVLPVARTTVAIVLTDDGRLEKSVEAPAKPAFFGYDTDGRLVGAVVTAEGLGYQDKIRVLYAYLFEQDAIVGFKVLDSKETPGLGDRIEKEAHFLANFEKLDVTLTAVGEGLLHPIVTVKQGTKSQPWQIDGITGATITSEAIGNILNDSAATWVPALEKSAHAFASSEISEEP